MTSANGPVDHEGRRIDFGRRSADYADHRPGFPPSFFDALLARGWIAAGHEALDLGTGTGTVALGFAEAGVRTTGIDIAPELLAVARERAKERGLSASFEEGRAESTGRPDRSVDLISAGQCWWWFDEEATIAEVQRVLRPGGRLLICNFNYLALPGNVAGRTEDLILERNPGWPKAGWRGVHPEQVRALDEAGFEGVESFSYVVDVPFTHEGWRGRMRTCNGVGSALSSEAVDAFDRALAERLDSEFPGELSIPHRIFAVSGRLP